MAKTDLPALASPGSRALKKAKYERYCRLRASAQSRINAYREAGWETSHDYDAYSNACRLERRSEIRDRISYLSRQEEDLIAEKRKRIEETLWAIHEANLADFFTTEDDPSNPPNSQNSPNSPDLPDASKAVVSPRVRVVPRPLAGAWCPGFTAKYRRRESCGRCSISAPGVKRRT
jgi:hypothetical protein